MSHAFRSLPASFRVFADLEPTCTHEFSRGLCQHCLAPETPADTRRADNARNNCCALAGHYSEPLRRWLTFDDALVTAWRSHRRQA